VPTLKSPGCTLVATILTSEQQRSPMLDTSGSNPDAETMDFDKVNR
jgi:hypothetical protein